jgi:hypothetical protein
MSNWKSLEKDIISWLSTFSSDDIEFRNSFQAIVGFPSDGPRSVNVSRVMNISQPNVGWYHQSYGIEAGSDGSDRGVFRWTSLASPMLISYRTISGAATRV